VNDHPGFSSLGNHLGDVLSALAAALALLGQFFGFLGNSIPYLSGLAALVWFCIQIWASRAIQHWWNNVREVRRAKRLVRLRAREKVLVAKIEALAKVRQARVEARDIVEQAKVVAALDAAHEHVRQTVEGPGADASKV